MMATWLRSDILVLDDSFSQDELQLLTSLAQSAVYEEQELGRGVSPYRARERAVLESDAIGDVLWRHLAPHVNPLPKWFEDRPGAPRVDPPIDRWVAASCNPRSRFYRYGLGGDFSEHEDEPWKPNPQRRSFLTVLVYLPTDAECVGGETRIEGHMVHAVPGRIVAFPHDLRHEGRPVEKGSKLVLRNDVVAAPAS